MGWQDKMFSRQLPNGQMINSIRALYEAKVKQQEAASKELRDRRGIRRPHNGANPLVETVSPKSSRSAEIVGCAPPKTERSPGA